MNKQPANAFVVAFVGLLNFCVFGKQITEIHQRTSNGGEKVPVWQINNNSIHTVMRFAGRIRKWQRLINYRLNGRLIRGRQMDCCWQLPLTAYYWCSSSHYPNQSDSPEWNEKEKDEEEDSSELSCSSRRIFQLRPLEVPELLCTQILVRLCIL